MAIRIMITDDHSIVREGLKKLLESDENIKVIEEADNGEECLQKLKQELPDVLLLDIDMPVMGGLDVLERIRELKLEVNVLVLTGHNEVEYLLRAVEIGIDGYILKSSNFAELEKAIDVVARGEIYIQSSLIPSLDSKMMESIRSEERR